MTAKVRIIVVNVNGTELAADFLGVEDDEED
jgi:hypothetical protein